MSRAKKKEEDLSSPKPDQWCSDCQRLTDHFKCWDTDIELVAVNPIVALHDADLAVNGEAA